MIRSEFKVHKLTDQGFAIAEEMAELFSKVVDYLEEVGMPSPELTLAKRKLEEACFYGKKAMAQRHCVPHTGG